MEGLLCDKKKNLKPTKTILTNNLGEKYETNNTGFCKKIDDKCLPFVVDNKPDLEIVEIISGVFLSSQDPIYCYDILKKYKIQHILSLGFEPDIKFSGISYYFVEILDLPEFNLTSYFDKCFNIINNCRDDNILVHCNAGVSRSPTIIIAYLIKYVHMNFDEAFDRVKKARPCVRPNEGFINQLKAFYNMKKE